MLFQSAIFDQFVKDAQKTAKTGQLKDLERLFENRGHVLFGLAIGSKNTQLAAAVLDNYEADIVNNQKLDACLRAAISIRCFELVERLILLGATFTTANLPRVISNAAAQQLLGYLTLVLALDAAKLPRTALSGITVDQQQAALAALQTGLVQNASDLHSLLKHNSAKNQKSTSKF